jgi:hypothetical protein
MEPGARLFIVEMAITTPISMSATLMDLGMVTGFTGQERELPHFTNLLHAADLEIGRAVELHRPYYLIEAHAQLDHVVPQVST